MPNSCPNSAPNPKLSGRKRVRCIEVERLDLRPVRRDPLIHLGAFYTVIDEHLYTTVDNSPWIEVQDDVTHQSFQRPRYMFGPVLSDDTRCSAGKK
jgi:hypothetical protein